MRFSTTQFLLVLSINLIFLIMVANHYFGLKERVSYETKTETVYKDKIINKCEASIVIIDYIKTATDACDRRSLTVKNFLIDENGNPKFTCD